MVIEKMKKHPRKEETAKEAYGDDVTMADEEDEVPMTHLASYALHKLFAEWAEQGKSHFSKRRKRRLLSPPLTRVFFARL